jgi:alpha-ketoglutarate-dependent taurine dioxygenase
MASRTPILNRSEYWHHDNDWSDEATRRIFNILHTVVLPDTPGPTSFVDVRQLRADLSPDEVALFNGATTTVELADIADYTGVIECPRPPPATHKVLDVHPVTGLPVAYLPAGTTTLSSGTTVPSMDIYAPLINRQPLVVHL